MQPKLTIFSFRVSLFSPSAPVRLCHVFISPPTLVNIIAHVLLHQKTASGHIEGCPPQIEIL